MVLNDIVSEYRHVESVLSNCRDYFTTCHDIVITYMSLISDATGKFYSAQNTDAARTSYTTSITRMMGECFQLITKLNSLTYKFYSEKNALDIRYNSDLLNLNTSIFCKHAQTTIDATLHIIEKQLDGMKKENLLPIFIKNLNDLLQEYHSLYNNCHSIIDAEDQLLEPLPPDISEENIEIFELRSYKNTPSLDEYAHDLSLLSSFMKQFEILMQRNGDSGKIYLRKFESGSLRIVFGSNGSTLELSSIPEIIKALAEGIRMFRLTGAEKRLMNEQARQQKLDNDEKELSIINSQVATISTTLNLSPDNPEDVETLQRLCLPLVRYIHNNPVGKVGDYEYDITSEVKLLEDFYFKKED